jgi:gliding motility-associated-like protein
VVVTADDTLCPSSSTTLQVRSTQVAQIITSTWYEGTTLLTRGPQLSITHNNPGTTGSWKTYRVVTSRMGSTVCDTERSIRIWMDASGPVSLAGNDPWLCPQKLVRRYAVAAHVPGMRYVWAATSGTLISQDSTGATISWQEGANDYELEVKALSSAGCITSTDRLRIREDRELSLSPTCTPADYPLSLPNVITPNNDGVNDGLVIENAQYYPQLVFKLYNRYGVQLLSKQGMADTWHPGTEIVAGTYFYHLESGRGQVLKGWLEVVR